MARYVGTVSAPVEAQRAFDYLADFSSVREWDPTVVRAEMVKGPPGEGAEFLVVVRFAGRELDFTYTTIAFEAPHRLVLRAESSTVISEDTITVGAAPGGCEVTYEADLRPKGLMKLADPVLGLMFKRLGDNAAAGLRRELAALRS
jgi:hypothetical protein